MKHHDDGKILAYDSRTGSKLWVPPAWLELFPHLRVPASTKRQVKRSGEVIVRSDNNTTEENNNA